jgi:predicted CopG family antitoxin
MTKTISISDEAYENLKRMKNGLSFSKIILALAKEKKKEDIMKFAGILSNKEGEEIMKEIKERRKKGSRRAK